jgi:hypothetical protein
VIKGDGMMDAANQDTTQLPLAAEPLFQGA